MAASKQTFGANTFASNTFACGTFRGLGVTPPPPPPPPVTVAGAGGGGGPATEAKPGRRRTRIEAFHEYQKRQADLEDLKQRAERGNRPIKKAEADKPARVPRGRQSVAELAKVDEDLALIEQLRRD